MKKNRMSNIGTSGFVALKSVAARCGRRGWRRSLAQVASLLVLAGTMVAASSRPAMAQGGNQFVINFLDVKCRKITVDDLFFPFNGDEVYAVIYVADLVSREGKAFLSKVFTGLEEGDVGASSKSVFGPAPLPNNNPGNVVIVTALLEHDTTSVENVRLNVQVFANDALDQTEGSSVDATRTALREAVRVGITNATASGGDRRIGGVRSYRPTAGNLVDATNGTAVTWAHDFTGPGDFRVRYEFKKQ